MFLEKSVLNICGKFTGEHPCRTVNSIKLQSNFIEITPRRGCSPVNLLHIFRKLFSKNTSGWLLLELNYRLKKGLFILEKFKTLKMMIDSLNGVVL